MASTRKDARLGFGQRDLINLSVKAQDIILKQGPQAVVGLGAGSYKTTDDLQFRVNLSMSMRDQPTNITTNISQEEHSKLINMLNRSQVQETGDQLLLPSIKTNRAGQQSPFKGNNSLFENSTVGQKMRKTTLNDKILENTTGSVGKKSNLIEEGIGMLLKENPFRGSGSTDRKTTVKMNPKVLETWINETLQDAEHLDIPGVILKPEHKNPISRYGIDRLALTNSGIPNEMVDRIFRALFVYSVGFYELIKKCLQHTERKYSIITSIWKVFSILLEYCCKTDYRMLISEISKEHKDELDKLEKEFQAKFQEQAHNERILKQNMEILQKYNEELEKDRTNERQMRLKLEEEYMQNTKNHEEEVQLRLKFESKLNNMHSVHRDLETRYKRALNELATLQNSNEQLSNRNNQQLDEITVLKTIKAENESRLAYSEEKLQSLQREINIKIKQVEDYEKRYIETQDELDLTKYKLQEAQKDITELRLKGDVYDSQVHGLKNEKQHLTLELKETKDLQKIYETKCSELMNEINKINVEFQESKREIIGFGEIQKERDERIEKLKKELRELKIVHEELDLKHGTLSIQYEKVKEQYETCKRDLDDAIEKLHVTNKVRHETEVKLHEEVDKNKSLNDIIKDKDDILSKRTQEIEELDKRTIELERMNEALEIKKAGVERQYELTKKQLNEKVQNLNDVLSSEKETREMWIERYEKEQRDHTATNAQLLQSKSQHKDQVLQSKNAEIKLSTQIKANEVLSESNMRLQDNLNEALAKCENLERELNTQKEIMKQMDQSKKEYIQKLKRELESVESRFSQKLDQISMITEDYHSRASKNWLEFNLIKAKLQETQDLYDKELLRVIEKESKIEDLQQELRNSEMFTEELNQRYVEYGNQKITDDDQINQFKTKIDVLEQSNKHLKVDADQKIKYQNEYNELLKNTTQLKKQLQKTQGNSNQNITGSNTINGGDRSDIQTQTNLLGPQLDQILAGRAIPQMGQTDGGRPVGGQGVRVGGGGEIKKPPPRRQPYPSQSQTQQPQLQIGGVIGQQSSAQSQTNSLNASQRDFNNQPLNQSVQNQINQMSKKSSLASNPNNSNMTIQSQKNLDIGQTPKSNQQLIQSLYPQTTTNQVQRNNQIQFNSNEQNNVSQLTSPRSNNPMDYISQNPKKINDYNSNLDETMASKISPSHRQQKSKVNENNTISSLLQSPQGTIVQGQINSGSKFMPQPNNALQTSLQQDFQNQNSNDYQTIQSNLPHNQSQDDSQFMTNSGIIASYTQQIQSQTQQQYPNPMQMSDRNNFQQYKNNNNVIPEQMYEDEEDNKRTPGGGSGNSVFEGQLYTQSNQSNKNAFANQVIRKTSNNSQVVYGNKGGPKPIVEYKGLSTVMRNQSNKNYNDQDIQKTITGENSNHSRVSKVSNQMAHNLPSKQNSKEQIYDEDEENEIEDEMQNENQPFTGFQDEEDEFNQNEYQERQISRQNEDSLAQDSVMNQSGYNTQNLQMNQQLVNQSRMKIDISSQERRNMGGVIPGQTNNNNTSLQSPLSQVSSGYSNNLIQQKFGMQQQLNPGHPSQVMQDNRKVKGKTSIRTLIKSAATRDNQ